MTLKRYLDLRRTGDLERERLLGDRTFVLSGDLDRERDLTKIFEKLVNYMQA